MPRKQLVPLDLDSSSCQAPICFGLANDNTTEECQACLVQLECCRAKFAPKRAKELAQHDAEVDLPTEKRLLILAVCEKYGIPTTYTDRAGKDWTITKENYSGWSNLDFILTSKDALRKLLTAKLE